MLRKVLAIGVAGVAALLVDVVVLLMSSRFGGLRLAQAYAGKNLAWIGQLNLLLILLGFATAVAAAGGGWVAGPVGWPTRVWIAAVAAVEGLICVPVVRAWAAGATGVVTRMLLGAQLRRLREANGTSREDAGYAIRGSESKISRMELGRVGFKERDVVDLLNLYGVTEERERTEVVSLLRGANTPGWWYRYDDLLPGWFQSYLGLEAAAVLIRSYEVQFVPGLLQTEAYARAVIRLGYSGTDAEEVERRVSLRIARQRVLAGSDPPRFWVVVDEAALRRPIGGPAVMQAQIDGLIEVTELPTVRLQVIPFGVGGHAAAGGAFTILRFPDRDLPDVVYIEQLTSAFYLDKPEDVDQYAEVMNRLYIEAAPPGQTTEVLRRIRRDIDTPGSASVVRSRV